MFHTLECFHFSFDCFISFCYNEWNKIHCYHNSLFYRKYCFASRLTLGILLLSWQSKWSCWGSTCGEELWTIPWPWELPIANNWHEVRVLNSVNSHKEVNSFNNVGLEVDWFFSVWASKWEYSIENASLQPLLK